MYNMGRANVDRLARKIDNLAGWKGDYDFPIDSILREVGMRIASAERIDLSDGSLPFHCLTNGWRHFHGFQIWPLA